MKKILTLFTALILMGSMTVVQADVYTVAGSDASIFGASWDPENAAADMTLSNGLYVFAKNVSLSSSYVELKVCKDHGWGTSYPSGDNYILDISAAGTYWIIITYNPNNNEVKAVAATSFTVAGDNGTLFGTTWSPSTAANDMTLDGGVYKFEKSGVALAAGTVNLKVCANHSWDNAWPGDNYPLSIPESGNYTITVTFNPATLAVNATADLEQAVAVIPTIAIHSNITNPLWESSANFTVAEGNETASLTLTDVTKGDYEFGMKIADSWTSNGSAFTRANNSHAIAAGSGNCTFNADRNGDYTFTWTYATNTLEISYPAIPAQSVTLTSIASPILKGTEVNFAATSSGIDNPGYRFYVKEKNGSYGSAVSSYTFNTVGEFTVKVEALENNTGDPVDDDEQDVVVYDAHTFTNGTTIYVDFTNVPSGGVNYPLAGSKGIAYDASGAGSRKTITFSDDVEWTTNDVFIKTEIGSWAELMFTVPGAGENCAVVAADGASYSWTTYAPPPATVMMNGNFADGSTMANTAAFDLASGNATTSLTLNLAAGDYDFTMLVGGETLGNGHTFHRDYTGASISGSSAMKLEADVAGDYTFTWTYATNALSITFPEEPTPEYVTVQFFAPRDETNKWEHVYAYSYKGSRKFLGDWPGTEITSTKDVGWYTVSVRKGSNLIFTDNDGMQTIDIENIQAAACYVPTAIDYQADPKIVTIAADANCEVAYYIAGSKTLIAGEKDFDTNVAMEAVGDDYQIVFHDVAAGTYAFKINNGTWAWALGGYSNLSDAEGCGTIAAEVGTGDIGFTISEKQDVTITYYPETQKICLGAVTVKTPGTLTIDPMALLIDEQKSPSFVTNIDDYTAADVSLSIVSGGDYIEIIDGQVKGVAAGEATVQMTIAETDGFAGASKTFTVTVSAVPAVAIQGSWDSWGAETSFTGDETSVSATIHLDAGSYEFKMLIGGGYRSNGYWYHRGYTGTEGITTNEDGNMSLTADVSGDYTFTWTFATNAISIELPELVWTDVRNGLTAGNYYTVCWPKKMVYVRGGSLWSFAGKDASMAYLVQEDAFVAGRPYIIYATADKLEAVVDGDDAAAGSNNGLYGTLGNMTNSELISAGATYMLYQNALHPIGGGHLNANRAYVILSEILGGEPSGQAPGRVRSVPMHQDTATGVESLQPSEVSIQKVMIDGQLFIIRGEKMYDATGCLVK